MSEYCVQGLELDIDVQSIQCARCVVYVANASGQRRAQRRQQIFVPDARYRVHQGIRNLCVFAAQCYFSFTLYPHPIDVRFLGANTEMPNTFLLPDKIQQPWIGIVVLRCQRSRIADVIYSHVIKWT